MRVTDGKMIVELPDSDPRVVRIRAILFEQPQAEAPLRVLWQACTDAHREVLGAIAAAGEISQATLERTLRVDAVGLRGRNAGLARLAKGVGVPYPIRTVGGRRDTRRFSLAPDEARQILKLCSMTKTRRFAP